MYDVIALGELLVDLAERSKDEAGYPTLAANPGGAPGNFLAALSAYGKKTAFLAKVGDDTFGRLLVGTMQRAGIDGRGIRIDPDTFTTLAFVTFDAHGDRSFAFARKPGADTQLRWDEIDPAMLDETVCLLSKLQSKEHIEIEVKMDELDLTSAESKATYEEIREYVFEHTGLKVSHLYIAQVKQKYGIIERENYNKPKSEDTRQPQCPPEKEKAITEALKHFGMI